MYNDDIRTNLENDPDIHVVHVYHPMAIAAPPNTARVAILYVASPAQFPWRNTGKKAV